MSALRDAAQQALEALDTAYMNDPERADGYYERRMEALRAALAEQPAEQANVRDAETELNCAEEVLDGYAAHLDLKETAFDCIGDYITAVCETLKVAAPQPAIPPGYKLVPEAPTNEWINNLARRQTGSLEEVPFVEIHQCIAELLESAPEAPQPKPAEQEPVAYLYHDARTPKEAHPWLHSTMLVLAADRRPGLRGETPLYTAPQPAKREPLTDEDLDAAVKAWFENDIVAGRRPFHKRMRAAIDAAYERKNGIGGQA